MNICQYLSSEFQLKPISLTISLRNNIFTGNQLKEKQND